MNITDIFTKDDNWKPVVRFGKVVEGYEVNKLTGDIYSTKTHRMLRGHVAYETRADGSKRPKEVMYSLSIKTGYYEDFTHRRADRVNCAKLPLSGHRAVAETFIPIDENPPEELADDWNRIITPDMVGQPLMQENMKQWVRDTAYIDHRDDDPTNNCWTNLNWTTPKKNNNRRKQEGLRKLAELEGASNTSNQYNLTGLLDE